MALLTAVRQKFVPQNILCILSLIELNLSNIASLSNSQNDIQSQNYIQSRSFSYNSYDVMTQQKVHLQNLVNTQSKFLVFQPIFTQINLCQNFRWTVTRKGLC